MYLGELAPKNLRGGLGVVPQLFITVGILTAQILGLRSLLANKKGKRGRLWATALPPLGGHSVSWAFLSAWLAIPSAPMLPWPHEVLVTNQLTRSSPS